MVTQALVRLLPSLITDPFNQEPLNAKDYTPNPRKRLSLEGILDGPPPNSGTSGTFVSLVCT